MSVGTLDVDAADSDAPDFAFDEPVDLSTPRHTPSGGTFAASKFNHAPAVDWNAKLGVEQRTVLPDGAVRPERWLPGTSEQATGVGWANVTAPGVLTWDQTAIETRIDPDQQGRLGVTLSRSIPVSRSLSLTLQNGYAVTHSIASGSVASAHATTPSTDAQVIEGNHVVKFTVMPADATISFGASSSSADDKWLRRLSAEQRLFGGPVSVTGAVSETSSGDLSKSLTAGFKRNW